MTELERARANLADAEAALAAGTNPYAEQNLATHRARVARLEAKAGLATPAAHLPAQRHAPAATVVPSPAPAVAAFPQPTGTREERLRRLGKAMGADAAMVAAAIVAGTSPDDFAVQIVDSKNPEAVAQQILRADQPVTQPLADALAEALAQAILAA